MSGETKLEHGPASGGARRTKTQPITGTLGLAEEGLPANLEAERYVLASVLLEGSRFREVAALRPGDFSLVRHRRIFSAMVELHESGKPIDSMTVADRLRHRGEQRPDDLSFLVSLEDGMPRIQNLESWAGILRRHSVLRGVILESHKVMNECLLSSADPFEILSRHSTQVAVLHENSLADRRQIRRVEDLESIFAKRSPVDYLVKPELPEKNIVCLTGTSESGKSTLSVAWARDVHRMGHAVLILDRDKNPRDRICDRLERLGVQVDGELFRIWDCEQDGDVPQPNDPRIVDWVQRMKALTGKSPLVIGDSLVSFFNADEDENSAGDMRAVFDRFRMLTKHGATVLLIHHTNRHGEARGSSDFKPASDQAFLVSNADRAGGRLLDVITLQFEKSRFGLSGRIQYHYASGKMLRREETPRGKTINPQLTELLKANPGILTGKFVQLGYERGLGRNQTREFLKEAARNGSIEIRELGRQRHHLWRLGTAKDKPDPQH